MTIKTPLLAVDCVILDKDHNILLIERKNPPYGWALPGGFVNIGETVEEAVRREIKEETNLELAGLHLLDVFSKPDRDPRGHVVSIAYIGIGVGEAKAKDDAKNITWTSIYNLFNTYKLAFDHDKIITKAMTKLTVVSF